MSKDLQQHSTRRAATAVATEKEVAMIAALPDRHSTAATVQAVRDRVDQLSTDWSRMAVQDPDVVGCGVADAAAGTAVVGVHGTCRR